MYYLSMFNFGLYPLVVGYITLLLALLLMFAMTMLILKIGRIVLVMLKQAMFEPGDKIAKKVSILNSKALRPAAWPKPIKPIKPIKLIKKKK